MKNWRKCEKDCMAINAGDKSARLLLIGGGGHCGSVIDAVLSGNRFHELGIIDSRSDNSVGIPVVGCDADLPYLFEQGWSHAFISLGSVGDPSVRRKLFHVIREIGFVIPTIIDPSAIIAKNVNLAEGIFIGKRVVVNANVSVGTAAILNSGAIIEHDCQIGEFAHISPGAILCGDVHVDPNAHVGAGAVIKQQIHIGANTVIGAGSVVLRDIPEGKVAYGNPCRVVKNL